MCNTIYNHMLKTPLSECTYGTFYSKYYTGRKKRGRVLVHSTTYAKWKMPLIC